MTVNSSKFDSQPIRIAGAGLAGLSTAINLAKQGHRVEVFEKRADAGFSRLPDWDAAENWTTERDLLGLLPQWGLSADFAYHPPREFEIYDQHGERYSVSTSRPLFYLLKRGPEPGSLEQALKTMALSHDVAIHFNQGRTPQDVDVWAAGVRSSGYFLSVGLTFRTTHPDIVMVLVSSHTAPKAYAYMTIVEGQGKLSLVLTRRFADARALLHSSIATFRRARWFSMDDTRPTAGFGGVLGAFLTPRAGPIVVGEAAGFQDYLWGFGIRYALFSGYLAAQAIDQGVAYESLIAHHIRPLVRSSLVNRLLYDCAGDRSYGLLIRLFSRSPDVAALLRRWYRRPVLRSVMWPIVRRRSLGMGRTSR